MFPSPKNRYPGINPYQYCPITLPNTTVYGNIWNILDAEFSHLNLSNPSRSSPFLPSSSSSSRNNSSPIDPYSSCSQYDENLQRMRIQSAVREQMGLNQFNNGRPTTTNNPPRLNQNGYDFNTPYYDGASTNSNQNGFRLRSNGFGGNDLQNLAPTLMELRGIVFLVAKDKRGCLYLQKKIEEANPEEIEMLFFELKDHARETHAMQKLLEYLTTQEQKYRLMYVLGWFTVRLTNHMNGNHHILHELADNYLDIATEKSRCCVLQHCLAHSRREHVNRLVAKIVANALVLSESRYGNYVVQFILAMKEPYVQHAKIVKFAQLGGNYVSLSFNKYSCNVVEKCLKEAGEDQAAQIIKEIINSPNFLMLVQDPYGNYVAQSAVMVSKGCVRQTILTLIQKHYPFLHSHPYGKRVLLEAPSNSMSLHLKGRHNIMWI
ncbi:unnamed protein product [Camellia sinensis]